MTRAILSKIYIIVVIVCLALAGCKKDSKTAEPEPQPAPASQTGSIQLYFQDVAGNENLEFGKKYVNANGDTFTVSKFNYYISNIVFTREDNTTYSEPYSYHLLHHIAGTTGNTITVSGVPTGSYKSVTLMLGVDSLHNVSGAQTGDLDPAVATDMFWSWSTGYIMLKLEGNSPKSQATDNSITFHIGGYKGIYKAQRIFSFNFSTTPASVVASGKSTIQLKVDILEMFKSPNTIQFSSQYNTVSPNQQPVKNIADNYADMIGFGAVIN